MVRRARNPKPNGTSRRARYVPLTDPQNPTPPKKPAKPKPKQTPTNPYLHFVATEYADWKRQHPETCDTVIYRQLAQSRTEMNIYLKYQYLEEHGLSTDESTPSGSEYLIQTDPSPPSTFQYQFDETPVPKEVLAEYRSRRDSDTEKVWRRSWLDTVLY